MARLSRRKFLQGLVQVTLLLFVPLRGGLAKPQAVDVSLELLARRLSNFFTQHGSAVLIGRQYLALIPHQASIAQLTTLISGSLENQQYLTRSSPKQVREFLSLQCSKDFESSRTVTIDGWILSETEARLCAIAALS